MKLREIGEDRLLGRLLPDLPLAKVVVHGPGDDCAVVETRDRRNFFVLKIDSVVACVQFLETSKAGNVGDDLFVTDRLGGATKQKHLQFVPRIAESRWLTKNFSIHAMIDISDGLGADLPRLAAASRVGFTVETENLPLTRGAKIDDAISEGEDYELLFA